MPIKVPSTTAILKVNMASVGLIGSQQGQLASAIANGFVNYITSAVRVATADVGILGGGTGIGPGLILSPPILISSLIGTFAGAGILGPLQIPLVTAIANSISQALLTAGIRSNHPSVGVGSGIVVTLVPNNPTHITSMIQAFKAHKMQGAMSDPLATAIATGIDISLPVSRGFVGIVGSPSIVPSGGVGIGSVF